MTSIIQNIMGLVSPFNQLLLLQKLFTIGIIAGIKKIIPGYTNDDSGMYKLINYYGQNKDNLSKIYFFLSLFAKQLNYGDYSEKTKIIIDDIKNRFFKLLNDIYNNNNGEIKKIIEPKTSKAKLLKSKTSEVELLKSKTSKAKLLKSKTSKAKLLKSKTSKANLLKTKTSKAKLLKSKTSEAKLLKSKTSKANLLKSKTSKAKLLKSKTPTVRLSKIKN